MKNIFKKTKKKFPYIIAEAGINHNGQISLAKKMVKVAKLAGADCIKFQNFVAEKYISKFSQKAKYQKNKNFLKKSQMQIIKETELGEKNTKILIKYCKKIGIEFLSTPFEIDSLKFLLKCGVKCIKVSSCNLNNYQFLEFLSKMNISVILSTGMSNFQEVQKAFDILNSRKIPVAVMQCTSNYPSKINNANINVIKLYKKKFKVPIGYSDHTSSNVSAIGALALGATFFEKHFTLSKKMKGIDQSASLEPKELKSYIDDLKNGYLSLGLEKKFCSKEEIDTRNALRRSVHASRTLLPGHIIESSDLIMKRPGTGLDSSFIKYFLGKKVRVKILGDTKLSKDQVHK